MTLPLAVIMGTLVAGSALAVQAGENTVSNPPAMPCMENAAAAASSVYVCPHCETVAMAAGKCSMCGKDMMSSHILGIKDGKAMVCRCDKGCNCDAKGMKDGKCACGKDAVSVSLKGMYVCPAGCPMVSNKPGDCGGCGKMMKKCE